MRQLASPCRRTGAALAELALALPLLGFAFLAAVDFARVFYYSQIVEECARSGALLASGTSYYAPSTTPAAAAQQAAVAAGAVLNPPLQSSDVAVSFDENNNATVSVTYTFQTLMVYPGIPQTTILTRTVTMPIAPTDPRWS